MENSHCTAKVKSEAYPMGNFHILISLPVPFQLVDIRLMQKLFVQQVH